MQEMQDMWVRSLGQEDLLEKAMATRSIIVAWKSHAQRNLARYGVHGAAESQTWLTEHTHPLYHAVSEMRNMERDFQERQTGSSPTGRSSLITFPSALVPQYPGVPSSQRDWQPLHHPGAVTPLSRLHIKNQWRPSLVVQWLRICLAVRGHWFHPWSKRCLMRQSN